MSDVTHSGDSVTRASAFANELELQCDETLILTGSATLPFDTAGGDLDLVLITPHESRFAQFAARRDSERITEQVANDFAMSYVKSRDGSEIDVEVWHAPRVLQAVSALGTEIRDTAAVEGDFTRVGGLDVKVGTDLLHALGWGIPLRGTEAFTVLHTAVAWPAYLAFKRDTALINVRDATKGIPSSLRQDRPDEAYLKLCWAADSLVDAMIFHSGLSITRWKWRLRYLPFLPPWVGEWYRDIRFCPALEHGTFTEHVEVLRQTRDAHGGSVPCPIDCHLTQQDEFKKVLRQPS